MFQFSKNLYRRISLMAAFFLLASLSLSVEAAKVTTVGAGIGYNGVFAGFPSDTDSSNSGALIQAQVNVATPTIAAAQAAAVVRGDHNLGAAARATDDTADKFTSAGSATSTWVLDFTTTAAGTIVYDLDYSGFLTVTAGGFGEEAGVQFNSNLRYRACAGCGYSNVPGALFGGSANIKGSDFINPKLTPTVTGVLAGSTLNGNRMDLSAEGTIIATLEAGRLYQLSMSLQTSADTGDFRSADAIVSESNSMSSFGFTGDFWDVVGGTASFYDVNDPTKKYDGSQGSVPEPSVLLLVTGGLLVLGFLGRSSESV